MNENTEMQNPIPEVLDENPQEATDPVSLACESVVEPTADVQLPEEVPVEDADLLPAMEEDPDPPSSAPLEDPTLARMQALESELADLKKELLEKKAEADRIENEYDELLSLYPNASLSDMPDCVWQDVKRGMPIAAAYALAERRAFLLREKAVQSNLENKSRSSGSVSGTESDYYTPGEVRMMSAAEVRSNYSKIINSMKKWH